MACCSLPPKKPRSSPAPSWSSTAASSPSSAGLRGRWSASTAITNCTSDSSLLHLQQICSKNSPNGCTSRSLRQLTPGPDEPANRPRLAADGCNGGPICQKHGIRKGQFYG